MKTTTDLSTTIIYISSAYYSILNYLPWPPLDLSILLNKLFDTALEIVVLFVGFILLNMYWSRREENRKGAPYYEYFKEQILFIDLTSSRVIKLIHQSFPPDKHEEVNKRNDNIKNEIERIEIIQNSIEKVITSGHEKLDGKTARGFAYYQTYLEPSIEIIIKHKNLEIQPNLTVLGNLFSELSKSTKELAQKLEEKNNELN